MSTSWLLLLLQFASDPLYQLIFHWGSLASIYLFLILKQDQGWQSSHLKSLEASRGLYLYKEAVEVSQSPIVLHREVWECDMIVLFYAGPFGGTQLYAFYVLWSKPSCGCFRKDCSHRLQRLGFIHVGIFWQKNILSSLENGHKIIFDAAKEEYDPSSHRL